MALATLIAEVATQIGRPVLIGHAATEAREAAMRAAGADDFLPKPLPGLKALRDVVLAHLPGRGWHGPGDPASCPGPTSSRCATTCGRPRNWWLTAHRTRHPSPPRSRGRHRTAGSGPPRRAMRRGWRGRYACGWQALPAAAASSRRLTPLAEPRPRAAPDADGRLYLHPLGHPPDRPRIRRAGVPTPRR